MMNDDVTNKYHTQAEQSELGQNTEYDQNYNPERLYFIPRAGKRQEIGVDPNALPFFGFDCWNHYEVSWLNEKGKPLVAVAEIFYDCSSPSIVESKSLKLYFNSFNHSKFKSIKEIEETIKNDLEKAIKSDVTVIVTKLGKGQKTQIKESFDGECIDELDIECTKYIVDPNFLTTSDDHVEEKLYSDLLKSNCLVTNQPDWGSVQIIYKGHKINREGLLRYIVSFRNHNEFHEQCIERIFVDIMNQCKPSEGGNMMTLADRIFAEGRDEGINQGINQGKEQGLTEGIQKAAKSFLAEGVNPRIVSRATGLTLDEIRQLQETAPEEITD